MADLPGADVQSADAVSQRAENTIRPSGALVSFDGLAAWLAGWQRTTTPHAERPALVVFFANHGVAAAEQVSAYPTDITRAVHTAHAKGLSTAAVFARQLGAQSVGVDVGIDRPSGDIRVEPALDEDRFDEIVDVAAETIAALDTDLLVFGEVGIGNTTAGAAVAAAVTDRTAKGWVGRGSGLDDEGLARKQTAVEAALRRVDDIDDPIELLREVGGAELVGIAAGVVAARRRSIPVLLDGFVVGASVLPLLSVDPLAIEHCLAAHCSAERGHRRLLGLLGREPLLDLGMRLGEGAAALAVIPLLRLAVAGVLEVPTFAEWFD